MLLKKCLVQRLEREKTSLSKKAKVSGRKRKSSSNKRKKASRKRKSVRKKVKTMRGGQITINDPRIDNILKKSNKDNIYMMRFKSNGNQYTIGYNRLNSAEKRYSLMTKPNVNGPHLGKVNYYNSLTEIVNNLLDITELKIVDENEKEVVLEN